MKTECRLLIFDTGHISPDIYMRLTEIFPQYIHNQALEMKLPFEHPDLQNALQMLDANGATPLDSLYPRTGDKFSLIINRVYEDLDLSEVEYLTPMHINDVGVESDSMNQLVINANHPSLYITGNDYLGARITQILVSDIVAERIRALGMFGLELRAVPVKGKPRRNIKDYWHLTSNVEMPLLSPSMVMIDENGAPYTGDPASECYLRDSRELPGSVISDAEFHYRKDDLQGMNFDFAYTAEKLFGLKLAYPVVSQKFYQMAKSLNLEIAWKPVRLD